MDQGFWAKAHGATTHFPVALVLCSAALDAAAFALGARPATAGLRAAGRWTMLLGALGAIPAVASGLLMTRGVLMGHDLLRLHHLFIWPAFGLLGGLAVWRLLRGDEGSPAATGAYLAVAGLAAALLGVAAYWGGEMMVAR